MLPTPRELQILQIEDSESDAALIVRHLKKSGLRVRVYRVEDAASMAAALLRQSWDAVISDYRVPGFGAPEALDILCASGLDIPFIVVSGTIGEDIAASMMRAGASDYLMKDNLARLAPAVEREVQQARARAGRRETEARLRESQDRLALAVEATQLGTFDYWFATKVLIWSGVTREQLGGGPDEPATARLFWRRVHADDRRELYETGMRSFAGGEGESFSLEFRVVRTTVSNPPGKAGRGEVRWLSTWARVFLGDDGEPARMIGTSRDVTSRKRSEEALRYQLDLTRAMAEQASDSIFVTDPLGFITYLNPEAERVFGFSLEEVARKSFHEAFHHHYPDGRPYPGNECPMTGFALRVETVRDHEDVHFRRDGTPIHTSCSMVPLKLDGTMIGAVITLRDITERKLAERALRESEARFRRLVDAGIIGIVIADQKQILEANDYFLTLLGHTRETFLSEKIGWRDITPPEHVAASERTISIAVGTGSAPPIEKEYIRRDGSRVPVLIGGVVIEYSGRRCFMGFALDRTEQKRLEEQVRQGQRLETVGLLAGGVAHDFNNLLTIILGYSRMVADDLGSEHALRGQMGHVVQAATRAAALTRQLLTFSRQDRTEAKVIRLNNVVRGVEDMVRRLIGETINTTLSLRDDTGHILADIGQMEQVIVNLALNARDAMPDGGNLWIETAPLDATDEFAAMCLSVPVGRYAQLVVSDNGTGMTPEVQSRIFEPFFTTKGPDKGTGLGLSTVYGIVKQAGGTISVHSSPGLGTTFRALFPVVQEGVQAELTETPPELSEGKGTILVVEDQAGILDYVREILSRAGYVVLASTDAEGAFQLARQHTGPLDLLLTDFILPGITGRDVVRRMEAMRPGIRSLIMSGYSDQLRHPEGDGTHLQKPFSANDLLSAIRAALQVPGAPPPAVAEPAGSEFSWPGT